MTGRYGRVQNVNMRTAASKTERQIDPRCKTCGFPHSNIAHVIDHLFVYDEHAQ